MIISKQNLETYYLKKRLSSFTIAELFGCSPHKINYWLNKYEIPKRSVSEAIYAKHNPNGDPFKIREPKTLEEAKLLGLGLGLYWGEGTKSNLGSVRLGNTDPYLIKKFIEFLEVICGVNKSRLRFGLQVFSDMLPSEALRFWQNALKVAASQFQKVVVTPARGVGNYRVKTKHGVLTVYCNNKKLRDIICQLVGSMRQ